MVKNLIQTVNFLDYLNIISFSYQGITKGFDIPTALTEFKIGNFLSAYVRVMRMCAL